MRSQQWRRDLPKDFPLPKVNPKNGVTSMEPAGGNCARASAGAKTTAQSPKTAVTAS